MCSNVTYLVSVTRLHKFSFRAQGLCESRGGRLGLRVPSSPIIIYGLCGRRATSEEVVLSRWLRCVPQECDVFRFARVSQKPREQCLLTCRLLRHPSRTGGGHPVFFSCAPMLQFLARGPLIHFQLDRNPSVEDLLETDHTRSLLPNKPPD